MVRWIFLNKNGSRKCMWENVMKYMLFSLSPFLERLLYTDVFVLLMYSKHLVCSYWPDCWHQEVCLASLQWQELNGLNDHLRISWLWQDLAHNFFPLCSEHSLIALPWTDLYPEFTLISTGFQLCATDILVPHNTVL